MERSDSFMIAIAQGWEDWKGVGKMPDSCIVSSVDPHLHRVALKLWHHGLSRVCSLRTDGTQCGC